MESLHRMTREERELEGLIVPGSDHLTAYNVYAEAFAIAGYIGEVYGLPRHLFDEGDRPSGPSGAACWSSRSRMRRWAWRACIAVAELPLPATMPYAREELRAEFAELLARVHAVRSRDR